jgi:hypothetical protein
MPVVTQLDGRLYLSDQRFPALRHSGFLVPLDNGQMNSYLQRR